jgi:hypothetical protein
MVKTTLLSCWHANEKPLLYNKLENSMNKLKHKCTHLIETGNECTSEWILNKLDLHESVHRDTTMKITNKIFFFCCGDPTRVMTSFLRFLDHTQRRTTVGRTPLDEWSARRRDLYLTTHNTHSRQTSMPPVGFNPTISAGERPQTYVLDRAATGSSNKMHYID